MSGPIVSSPELRGGIHSSKRTASAVAVGSMKQRRTETKQRAAESKLITGNSHDNTVPAAMAWGSDRRALVTGRVEGEEKESEKGKTNGICAAETLLLNEDSLLPPERETMPPPKSKRYIEAIGAESFLPDSVLCKPNSHQPLEAVDLSIWQDGLSTTTVEDLLCRNRTFSKLTLRGARRSFDMLALIAQHLGRNITDIDVSGSAVVDAVWLTTLGAECPALTSLTAAHCNSVTDKAVEKFARKKGPCLRTLSVANCPHVSDDGVEILAKHCTSLRSIDLSGCPRVRDRSVYAMSSLVGLRHIALDGCAEVSDEAVRHLFTSVAQLKSLSIKGCASITEEGLRFMHEMPVPWGTRRHRNCAQLQELRVGRNDYISDDFLVITAAVCPRLRVLEVTACPLLGGDEAMGKVGGLLELVDVTLEALLRVSDQGVRQLVCDVPRRALKKLSLAGCSKVTDVSLKCIAKNARGLQELRLDRNVSVTDRGLGYLAKGLVTLRLLQATHLGMVTDAGVRTMARKCLQLTEVDFSHCIRLTAACFSALHRLRILESLSFTSCQRLFDGAMNGNSSSGNGLLCGTVGSLRGGKRATTTTALDAANFLNLRRLELSQHPNLTDAAVLSVAQRNCRTLTWLDISQCSGITAVGVTEAVKVFSVLKRLDVTGCARINAGDVEHFARCAAPRLLLSCAQQEADGFEGLHCRARDEDARSRNEVEAGRRTEEIRAKNIQWAFRRYRERRLKTDEADLNDKRQTYAAVTIQFMALRFISRRKLHDRAMRRARLMLSVFKWRRRTKEARAWSRAVRHGNRVLLVRTVRDWRASAVEHIIETSDLAERGELFFDHILMKTHLRAWIRYTTPLWAKRGLAEGKADEFWCERTRKVLFRRWHDNVRQITRHRARMTELMLFVLPVEFRNSMRQRPRVERAVKFHRRRVLRKAWEAFVNLNDQLADLQRRCKLFEKTNRPRVLRRNLTQLQKAVAIQKWMRSAKAKADAVSNLSLQRRSFRSLRAATAVAAASRRLKERADAFANRMLVTTGWEALREHPAEKKILLGLMRLWQQRGAGHRNQVLKKKGMRCFKDFTRRQLRAKIATANILSKYMATTKSTCFMAWKLYHRTLKNAAEVIKKTNETTISLERIFAAWVEVTSNSSRRIPGDAKAGAKVANASTGAQQQQPTVIDGEPVEVLIVDGPEVSPEHVANVADDGTDSDKLLHPAHLQQKEGEPSSEPALQPSLPALDQPPGGTQPLDAVGASVTEKAEEEQQGTTTAALDVRIVDYPEEWGPAAVLVQTAWRGLSARNWYDAERVTRQWATVKVQALFRARKARKVFAKQMRYKHIRDMVKEEAETEAMVVIDRESRRLMEYHRALSTIGRVVLGYKGRKLARERRREGKLDEAGRRFAEKEEALRRHEEAKRRLAALRKDQRKAALLIQVTYRGYMARVRVKEIREENRWRRAATAIQCMIRFRGARHNSAARNRHRERTSYIHLGRQRQALFLRLAGLRHRRSQRPAIRLLRKAGADLMGFTTSLRVQMKDLRQDARLAWAELEMTREAFRVGGRDAYRRRDYIRAHKLGELQRKRVQRGDAVQILNRDHEFCGFTGRVLHVDARDPCREVAEVKLDDGTGRVVYVPLLAHVDGKDELPDVNMIKIDRKEIPQHTAEDLALVREALLAWAVREREWWRPYLAAVAIQRRIRGYLARRATARRRYHYWIRERAQRLTLLRALDVTNVATYQAVRAAVKLRLIRAINAPTNMPWVPPMPPRLEDAIKLRWRRIILEEELRARMVERSRIASKDLRKLKWKTTTYGPVIRPLNRSKEVLTRLLPNVARPKAVPRVFRLLSGSSYTESLNEKVQARAVYTGGFHFTQLEASPHVRTGGRALFHGCWGRSALSPSSVDKNPSTNTSSSSSSDDDDPEEAQQELVQPADGDEEGEDEGKDEEEGEGDKEAVVAVPVTEEGKEGGVRGKGREGQTEGVIEEEASTLDRYSKPPQRVAWGWPKGDRGGGGDTAGDGKLKIEGKKSSTKKGEKPKTKKKRKKKTAQTKLQPHGEGYVEFLDGWGVSQEEKTLYVTVVSAKDLAGMDRTMLVQHCDPFFQLKCNGKTEYTSTKRNTREPKYNESFEFDVSNPASVLSLECWEEDTFSNTYVGGATISIRELSNGEKVRSIVSLNEGKFRRPKLPKKQKLRGNVELVLQWLPKATEDDVSIRIRLSKAAVVLQCWARTIVSRRVVAEAKVEASVKAKFAFAMTLRIQMSFRRHSAREQLRLRRMWYRNACILQKFARRKLAFMEAAWRRKCKAKATIIQCFARQHLSRIELARLREERRILERDMSTRIQARARVKLARLHVAAIRDALRVFQGESSTPTGGDKQPVAEWLPTYGTDPYYPSKRIRRITERVYYQILGVAGSVLETRFGTASVLRYPANACLSERGEDKGTALRNDKCTVEVLWKAHADLHWPRTEREAAFEKAPTCYRGFLNLESAPADRTVDRRMVVMQCSVRVWIAKRVCQWQSRARRAAVMIQRAYRRYLGARTSMLKKVQGHARVHLAKRRSGRKAREKRSVIAVQCAYRAHMARLAAAYKRVIRTVKVTGSSGCSDPLYGPENCVVLDPSDESSLWSSPYGEVTGQWITFDLGTDCPVGAVRLLAMSNTTCPKLLRVECCRTKKQAKAGDWTLAGSFRVKLLAAWQRFEVARRMDNTGFARWWKITIVSNHGNTTAVAVNGIQFLLAKEESPRVLVQSHSMVVTPPPVGTKPGTLELNVEGTAWPPHRYQWYHNDQLLEGETRPRLEIRLHTAPSQECRPFRCIHCKHAAPAVPRNAGRVICGNCDTPFVFKEYESTVVARSAWEGEIAALDATVEQAERAYDMAVVNRDKARLEALFCVAEGKEKTAMAKLDLDAKEAAQKRAQEQLSTARQAVNEKHRELLKTSTSDPLKVHHDFEGLYECRLSNIRGGTILRTVPSRGIYIFARDPPPLRLKVRVKYVPKEKLRRRYWPKYEWAFGWFTHGKLGGDILIKYHDGALYDGPYVLEACLDLKGRVPPEARIPGHWGTWITKSGWTYAGPFVDNHFDMDYISGLYRLTAPGGEVYEGDMLDEQKHGMGEHRYADGTVYSGEWHRGQRQGFGKLVSLDGAEYEGEFDHDMIHGEGLWSWPDGSSYAGEAKHGLREGKGLYASEMRDTVYGNFHRNKPHGVCLARYCDGSSYDGEFKEGMRHGKGTLEDSKGVRSTGTWVSDKRDGEFELRTHVFVPELQEHQDEIRVGLWEDGEFVEWISPPVYPHATQQFYEMFEEDDSQYDGVYAMLVAKKLPNLPHGVDPNNPRVVACVRRIAAEAGQLCASDTIEDAQKQIAEAIPPHDSAVSKLQCAQVLERVCRHQHEEKMEQRDSLERKIAALVENRDKLEAEVEQFYADDPGKTRELFLDAVKRLKTFTGADWFMVRNYDRPPSVLATLLSAVCTLMLVRDSWKSARNLVGSSVQNMEEGDEEALVVSYDCKLVHRLETEFSPYTRCDANDVMLKLATFVVDPRFQGASLFLKLYGDALGPLADLVKAAYNYIVKAAEIKPRKMAITGVEGNIKYAATCLQRERQEEALLAKQVKEKVLKREEAEAALAKARTRLDKAKALLEEARALVTVYVAPRDELDTYEKMESELDPLRTEVEVVLELAVREVEGRLVGVVTEGAPFDVEAFIVGQTQEQVSAAIAGGIYTFTAGSVQRHDDVKVSRVKSDMIEECKRLINACLHDAFPERGRWKSLQGQTVEHTHLRMLLDGKWEALLRSKALKEAVDNWTNAFPGEGEAAYQALLSVSNEALSDERKAEAQLWLDNNVEATADIEWSLAGQFAEGWPEGTAEGCIQVLEGSEYGPDVRLQATAWEKHNKEALRQYRADNLERLAGEFSAMWSSEQEAASEVIAIRERQDAFQGPYAEAWASFHLAEMVTAEAETAKRRAAAFEDRHPDGAATHAVKIVVAKETSAAAAPAEDLEEEQGAIAWCALHGRAAASAEDELAAELLARDSKAAGDQEILERRLRQLEANKPGGDSTPVDDVDTGGLPQDENLAASVQQDLATRNQAGGAQGSGVGVLLTVANVDRSEGAEEQAGGNDAAAAGGITTSAAASSVAGRKAKKKGKGGVKKSKAQQFAEKQEADRLAKEEEEERRRQEEKAAEDALNARPKSKAEQLTDLLAGKLAERVQLCEELLVLLRRAQKKAEDNDSPRKALSDPSIRPSERQAKHDALLEERRQLLAAIAARISDAETKAEEARLKFEAAGGVAGNAGDALMAGGSGGGDGWTSYLDEQSGRYYWFNEETGEAYYDEGGV